LVKKNIKKNILMKYLKFFLPRIIKNLINSILNRNIKLKGNYSLWKDACKNSSGYDDNVIFNKAKKSFNNVINNKAKFERDTVLFYEDDPDLELIYIIKKLYNKKNIRICDFGGSFASSYFQNISFLDKKKIEWNIVEQKKIVKYAKEKLKIKDLNFYYNIKNILNKNIDLIIFSSVIQYLEDPYVLLKEITKKKIKNIIISRTPFFQQKEIIKIQYVPKHIYNSSYPVRIFNNFFFLEFMKTNGYKIKKKLKIDEKIDKYNYESYYFVKD
jgi:putative methyltransferase (TIGR04325 family)